MNRSRIIVSDTDFCRFKDLILDRTGIILGLRGTSHLTQGLQQYAEAIGCFDLGDIYMRLSRADTSSEIWDKLADLFTVCETYFFRDQSQFQALREHILPGLIQRRLSERRLRIWSAGCATGEEPYSVAILLHELIPDIEKWRIHILATDLNKRVLRKAGQGVYKQWSFRQCESAVQNTYFEPRGDCFALKPMIRDMVTLGYLNLVEDAYPSLATNTKALDLIIFRNVAIYQTEKVTRQVVERFCKCLLPGGWLMVSATETEPSGLDGFETRRIDGSTFYQVAGGTFSWRAGQSPPGPKPAAPPVRRQAHAETGRQTKAGGKA